MLSSDISYEELKEKLDEFTDLCMICNSQSSNDEKGKTIQAFQEIITKKIAELDAELRKVNEHIELPDNEKRSVELQTQIEMLEETFGKAKVYSKAPFDVSMAQIKEMSEHKNARIAEQGKDMSEIMQMIENGDSSTDFYVEKKSEYLEKKLEVLKQYTEIPGNAYRIEAIEQELEQMQDAWKLKKFCTSRGITPNKIVDYNNRDIQEKSAKIEELQEKLNRELSSSEPDVEFIKNIETHMAKVQSEIEMLQQDNKSIKEKGISFHLMGEHHKARLDEEEKAKETQEQKTEETARVEEKKEEQPAESEQHEIESEPETTVDDKTTQIENEIQQMWDKIPDLLEYDEPTKEKHRTEDESIKDEVGDEEIKPEETRDSSETYAVNLWMNRFEEWNSVVDKLSDKAKAKFIKMKSDIVKAIRSIIRERANQRDDNAQNQDTNER